MFLNTQLFAREFFIEVYKRCKDNFVFKEHIRKRKMSEDNLKRSNLTRLQIKFARFCIKEEIKVI